MKNDIRKLYAIRNNYAKALKKALNTLFGGHIMIVNTDTDTSFKLIQLLHQNINKYED
jgi:hypothetical protein